MKRDIRKLGFWLEQMARKTVAEDRKLLEWKLAEEERKHMAQQVAAK